MISIRKHMLEGRASEANQALLRVTDLLLEGIALNSVESDGEELAAFQATVRRLGAKLSSAACESSELLVTGGSVIQALQDYSAGVRRRHDAQNHELHSIIALLTTAVATAFHGNERAICALRAIESRLQRACQLEDLQTVKFSLGECLATVQIETISQASQSCSARGILSAAASVSPVRAAMEDAGADPVTGLPARSKAKGALSTALSSSAPQFAVVLIVNRIQLINSRYGVETGDCVLLKICQSVTQRLRPGDQLFRWSGPTLLALLKRETPIDAVRAEIAHYWDTRRLEDTIQVGERTVLLSVSTSSLVLPVWKSNDVEALAAQIDAFVLRGGTSGG